MPRQKRYAYGEKTTKETKYEEVDKLLREKWKKDHDSGNIRIGAITLNRSGIKSNNKKKNRQFVINSNGEIVCVETCCKCGETKPITPLYYNTEYNNSCVNNIDKQSGEEQISNTPSGGCRDCIKQKAKEKSKTDVSEYRRILLKKYLKLKNSKWYETTPNICAISNINLIEKNNVDWRVSIQNNGFTNEHLPENCCKIAYEFNVQEHNAIPSLIDCWKDAFKCILNELKCPSDTSELIEYIITRWNNSPKENGVNVDCQIIYEKGKKINPEYSRQCMQKHLPRILQDLQCRYKNADKISKRNPETSGQLLTTEQIYNKLIAQNGKCFYTGIPFAMNRDNWKYFSLERLNNNLNHTDENTVLICRMFNSAGGLNRRKILTALLSQIHIPLSIEDKRIIETELQNL